MELTLWTYEGPPHVGALRVAASMEGVHLVLHAPQGDTYADLLFTMIERRGRRPPVTYTTFQARDLGGDTAELVKRSIAEAAERFQPEALLVGESCTAELIQDQPAALAQGMGLGDLPVVGLELPAYSKKENWGAAETFYQLVRSLLKGQMPPPGQPKPEPTRWRQEGRRPRVNLLGPTLLGFRCRDDVREISRLLAEHGIDVSVVAPLGARPADLQRLPSADLNVCLYPELAGPVCSWLERSFGMATVRTVPIGIGATAAFLRELHGLLGLELPAELEPGAGGVSEAERRSRLPWYSRSVDSTYLTGKRVFIFGDASHAIAAARVATQELGFQVVGLGSYSRELAREVRAAAAELGLEALISDDYLAVEAAMAAAAPELVLGTQMERHSAKRLGIPCAVISTPLHVQDVPARQAPQMGWEGANELFDAWVHPLMMGLEEHLIGMFRHDFEFVEGHRSHLGGAPAAEATGTNTVPAETSGVSAAAATATPAAAPASGAIDAALAWTPDGEAQLARIPFFVRGKVRRNTERYARDHGLSAISEEVLFDAKAHYSA
ncbi:ferredoxin:protochlorophyllide reductase (ATP-dependent) subunit B [Vulcanococcus limneticus Candia 3F8]|uniref:ferredoxin:protochlorophyllide reductase (ATP-dependent) subunit B n=1 Tax=Vulcanococcus limneticus TaxID=2170428 RepID=UPI000B997510|nr:ferredoxin:protochlorophyllide reductase (ATP-dependent) subunit B [Vulcanococcus limneticus]MCP9791910.1 ferredoxin:protochlorophyllide reductase (ATP-dependent) subunit B [Vulcanococcus limneticus MW73D5]MCP9893239.1 ferredoxin:protochlorophyllide reductase (ATP-dependent) subunit B [Vulcanococcus limneticus Candia 3F8]MCP9897382.1 ferredoxin:protochlorophyllide reductase (ATP-dependent) subunit B [Vulcanococcus limneticus Candia 3B3]